jgi:hypothetical protein
MQPCELRNEHWSISNRMPLRLGFEFLARVAPVPSVRWRSRPPTPFFPNETRSGVPWEAKGWRFTFIAKVFIPKLQVKIACYYYYYHLSDVCMYSHSQKKYIYTSHTCIFPPSVCMSHLHNSHSGACGVSLLRKVNTPYRPKLPSRIACVLCLSVGLTLKCIEGAHGQ